MILYIVDLKLTLLSRLATASSELTQNWRSVTTSRRVCLDNVHDIVPLATVPKHGHLPHRRRINTTTSLLSFLVLFRLISLTVR